MFRMRFEPTMYDSLLLEFAVAHKPTQPPRPDVSLVHCSSTQLSKSISKCRNWICFNENGSLNWMKFSRKKNLWNKNRFEIFIRCFLPYSLQIILFRNLIFPTSNIEELFKQYLLYILTKKWVLVEILFITFLNVFFSFLALFWGKKSEELNFSKPGGGGWVV